MIYSPINYLSNKVVFLHINLGLTLFFLFFRCGVFCCRLVVVCFVVNLLRWVILSTISFFAVFALTIQMTKFNLIKSLDQIIFISILQI